MNEAEDHEWSETLLRVRYAETDQAGVVYHSNYLIWFEVGRVELCRDYGFNYRDMETEADAFLPVTEARVKYRAPARYDDEVAWAAATQLNALLRRQMVFFLPNEAELVLAASWPPDNGKTAPGSTPTNAGWRRIPTW